jgi:membrane-associated phospholipid phosphatase
MTSTRPRPAWLRDAERVDVAVYTAIAATPTPALDDAMRRLASAADNSRISFAIAGVLALTRGAQGRRAALAGVSAVAVTSATVNLLIKPLARRRRPDRELAAVPIERHVEMPTTRSFPSGHTAAAFAFATAVGDVLPHDAIPLAGLAFAVGYSRVHTGVHFPGDVTLGAVIGTTLAQLTVRALHRQLEPAARS